MDIKIYKYVYTSGIDFTSIEGPRLYDLFFRWLNSTYGILNYEEMDFLIDLFQNKKFNVLGQESGEMVIRDEDNYIFSAKNDGKRKKSILKSKEVVSILTLIKLHLHDVHMERGNFVPVESKPDEEDLYGYIKYFYKVDSLEH